MNNTMDTAVAHMMGFFKEKLTSALTLKVFDYMDEV